jgi:hypothetical protein
MHIRSLPTLTAVLVAVTVAVGAQTRGVPEEFTAVS